MMTVGLLAVVVYLYTVVAFNFFRKFYNKSEDEDEPDMKCDDMMTVSRWLLQIMAVVNHTSPPKFRFMMFSPLQCYLFHMYVGVRAGGGIGDEIEDPAGDEYELYRVVFDITFFFFVIVILLAIIQGKDGAIPYNWFQKNNAYVITNIRQSKQSCKNEMFSNQWSGIAKHVSVQL